MREVEAAFDTDGDGIADFLDLDADDDGNSRYSRGRRRRHRWQRKRLSNLSANGTLTADTNRDGLDDLYDINNGGTAISFPDTDNDGIDDTKDLDADNDGIPDVVGSGFVHKMLTAMDVLIIL